MWAGVSELLCRVNSGSMLYHASKLRLYPLRSVVLSVDSEKSEGTLDITQLVGWLMHGLVCPGSDQLLTVQTLQKTKYAKVVLDAGMVFYRAYS